MFKSKTQYERLARQYPLDTQANTEPTLSSREWVHPQRKEHHATHYFASEIALAYSFRQVEIVNTNTRSKHYRHPVEDFSDGGLQAVRMETHNVCVHFQRLVPRALEITTTTERKYMYGKVTEITANGRVMTMTITSDDNEKTTTITTFYSSDNCYHTFNALGNIFKLFPQVMWKDGVAIRTEQGDIYA